MRIVKLLKRVFIFVISTIAILLIIEIGTAMTRGYGFFTTSRIRLKNINFKAMLDLDLLNKYSNTYWENTQKEVRPSIKDIDGNIPKLCVSKNQPYKNYDIWILESKSSGLKYLYKPFPFDWSNRHMSGNFIISCAAAVREEPKGIYHPYKKYPEFVLKELGGERWACYCNSTATMGIKSDIPPIPGAFFGNGTEKYGEEKIYYPKSLLPVMKAIYPNAVIPPDQIIKENGQ